MSGTSGTTSVYNFNGKQTSLGISTLRLHQTLTITRAEFGFYDYEYYDDIPQIPPNMIPLPLHEVGRQYTDDATRCAEKEKKYPTKTASITMAFHRISRRLAPLHY